MLGLQRKRQLKSSLLAMKLVSYAFRSKNSESA